jgi:SapC
LIDPNLFQQPVALDRQRHAKARFVPRSFHQRSAGMNALFLTAVEFIDAGREYPIVFIEAGTGPEGQRDVAPMAVLGLTQGENLMLGADGSWGASYMPALLRGYPFGLASTGEDQYVVVVDEGASALSDEESGGGERLFDDGGTPTPMMAERQRFVEQIEAEAQRTRLLGRALLEMDLLKPMRFDATLPGGEQLGVEGFLAVDDQKFSELPAERVAELHKSGVLGMIYAHLFSMPLMRSLVERRLARRAANDNAT